MALKVSIFNSNVFATFVCSEKRAQEMKNKQVITLMKVYFEKYNS